MKSSKILLALSTAFFLNVAHADQFLMVKSQLADHKETGLNITLPTCAHANEIKIKADVKVELVKAQVNFQSGKDKNIIFLSTLEEGEATNWRVLGYHAKNSCVQSIVLKGFPKHAATANIEIFGKKD